jgi:hypothetical protein
MGFRVYWVARREEDKSGTLLVLVLQSQSIAISSNDKKQQEDLCLVGENTTNQSTLVVLVHDSRKKIRAKASLSSLL